MISSTIIVVADVLKVLLKVEFNALSITLCLVSSFDWRLKNSLILSKTTTVSFKEYPITVKIAAIKA